jgi:hypothetical protein
VIGTTIACALALAGCGSQKHGKPLAKRRQSEASVQGAGVPPSAIAVIDGWADALREGHLRRAAAYWALPSVLVNGPNSSGRFSVLRIDTLAQALAADETLPCAATLRTTSLSGDFIQAGFTLSPRRGVAASDDCAGPASVDLLIRGGLILHWIRVPLTGGNRGGGEPATQAQPATSI